MTTTPNWDFLLDETLLASVLPDEFGHFARPIRDGLTIFLGGLHDADQAAILRAQASLAPNATTAERLGMLARCSPVLQKLGQVLARDQRLSPEFRHHLRQLESLPPTISLATIEDILTRELGPLNQRGVRLAPAAIAEASVAVVIAYEQGRRTNSPPALSVQETSGADGVFKILKPGIEERLELELSLLQRVGEHLDRRCDMLSIPHVDYVDAFQQVREKLCDEVDLENERRHLAQARRFFADEPRVEIPELFEHYSSRVTSMARIHGVKVTDHPLSRRSEQRELARLITKALITKPLFSPTDRTLFHCDPHAGNLFFTNDGRLAILDWSLIGRLGERERTSIVQVMLGAITLDPERIVMLLTELSDRRPPDATALRSIVRAWIRRIRGGQFPGLGWLTGMLDDAVQNAQLSVSSDLMLFRKSLHTLEGVVAEVGGSAEIDEVLCTEFVRQFAVEWPQRWLRSPQSRDFATRLSNLDLTHTLLSYPITIARLWTGHAVDVLETCSSATGTDVPSAKPAIDDDDAAAASWEPGPNIPPEMTCP